MHIHTTETNYVISNFCSHIFKSLHLIWTVKIKLPGQTRNYTCRLHENIAGNYLTKYNENIAQNDDVHFFFACQKRNVSLHAQGLAQTKVLRFSLINPSAKASMTASS